MDEKIGVVPENVKTVVNLLELVGTSWLGDITAADVSDLEEQVCRFGKHLCKVDDNDDDDMENALGFEDGLRSFKFTMIEKKSLVAVAGAVKQYGVHYFTKM